MIRSLSVIALGAVLAWPVAANAQRGGGGGGRGSAGGGGGTAARGSQGSARQGGITVTNPLVNTTNRAPQGGALGTPGGSGPWVGGAAAQIGGARTAVRGARGGGGRFNDVAAVLPQYNYPVYPQGFYGIPTFTTGFDTGYY